MRRLRRAVIAALGATAVCVVGSRSAAAHATFVIVNEDPAGQGFNDPTPAAPVGGNTGTTLGEQRQIAFQFAADIWGKALDSTVPIVVGAKFGPLQCQPGLVILGSAQAASIVASVPPRATVAGLPPNMFFPQALADRLAGVDLDLGQPDIIATFNGGLHDCDPVLDWYYGLDGDAGSLSDLVEIVVHELAHGLGFSAGADLDTGAFQSGIPDTFSAHLFDNATGLSWLAMTDAQRAASMKDVRHLVWVGDNVMQAAARVLDTGAPLLGALPPVAGLDGDLGEANFGPRVADVPTQGPLVVGNPSDGCGPLQARPGGIFLLVGGNICSPLNQADYATRAGAVALLLTDGNGFAPPSSLDLPPNQVQALPVTIPVVTIAFADGQRLADASAGGTNALTLSGQNARLTGADPQGRPYLYASDPVRPGSTVSHWDPLARPDLVEEPESGYQHPHDVTMEAALMRDIGWLSFCGNGQLDPDEQCDDGPGNNDVNADACRTTCSRAHCGDGITDTGEACDLGARNGEPGTACTTTCAVAAVVPPGPTPTTPSDAGAGCRCAVGRGPDPRAGRAAEVIEIGLPLLAAALAARRRSRVRRAGSRLRA